MLEEIANLVTEWQPRSHADRNALRMLLCKLLNVTQCCPLARLFFNRMLDSLRACPSTDLTRLTPEVRKDWFAQFLPSTNGVFMIHEDSRTPFSMYIDAYTIGAGVVLADEAYYTEFPAHMLLTTHPICGGTKCHGSPSHVGSKAVRQGSISVL